MPIKKPKLGKAFRAWFGNNLFCRILPGRFNRSRRFSLFRLVLMDHFLVFMTGLFCFCS
ncbi:MAG: hypothetical protein OEL85_00315 [Desulfobulbaceae bacterium]|nr:hypothetical protein [Desulfobulbaceae bacterium]